jgi:hypothetical protein
VLGEASLEANGAELARGRLVRFLGQLALQIVDHSTR